MAEDLLPHRLSQAVGRVIVEGEAAARRALTLQAQYIEDHAKRALNERSHAYGTPTPARPGGPPAKISGDLMRSVSHTEVAPGVEGLETRVGPASLPHTNYRSRQRRDARGRYTKGGGGSSSTSGQIGLGLETGRRKGGRLGAKYPFLLPAFREGVRRSDELWRVAFEVVGREHV